MKPCSLETYKAHQDTQGCTLQCYSFRGVDAVFVGVVTLALKILLKLDIIFDAVSVYGRYKLISTKSRIQLRLILFISPQNIK